MRESVCVCERESVCAREIDRERDRERECVCANIATSERSSSWSRLLASLRFRLVPTKEESESVREKVCVCVCVIVCVCEREGGGTPCLPLDSTSCQPASDPL